MHRITLISILWLALLGSAHAEPIHIAKLAKVQLQLEAQGQTCQIRDAANPATTHSVNLPWPCQFHLDKAGHPRIVRSGKFEYLLIEASSQLANSRDCDTQLRAVRAKASQWKISEHQDKVAACPPFQWDNMIFSALFK